MFLTYRPSRQTDLNVEPGVKVVKIGPIVVEICQFCRLVQKGALVMLAISGVTGLILIKFAHDVRTILPLNILNRNCHSPTRFGTLACRMKVILPILHKIGCHGDVP